MIMERCDNCAHWSIDHRHPYDAGAASYCKKLTCTHGAHMSDGRFKLVIDGYDPGEPMYVQTRWDFGCNQFKVKQNE